MRSSLRHLLVLLSLVAAGTSCGQGNGTEERGENQEAPARAPVPKAASGPGWTTFRGGPQRTGRASVSGPRTAELKWVFRTRDRVYADVAVTSDNTVYVASHDGRLYAVGPDGREIWAYDSQGKIWSSPAVSEAGLIYFGSDSDRLIALEPDGKEHWTFPTGPEKDTGGKTPPDRYDVDTSPLLLPDGTAVFGCHLDLFAVRPSGLLRWRFKAGVGKAKLFSSPALGPNGAIYFGNQGRYFFALDENAKMLFNVKTEGDNDSTPAVGDDGTAYFGSDDGRVRAVAKAGWIRWVSNLGAPVRAPVAVGSDGTVFASTFGSRPVLAALDGATGRELWRYAIEPGAGDFYGIRSGALVDAEGYVYFGAPDHHVYCLDPRGRLVWRYETGDRVDAGPALGPDGTLYVGSADKRLYAFGPFVETAS